MALSVKVGSFQISTTDSGTLAITGIGFQPEFIEFFPLPGNGTTSGVHAADGNSYLCYGATDGANDVAISTSSRDAQSTTDTGRAIKTGSCVYATSYDGSTVFADYSVSSFDADGFTLTVNTAPGSNQLVMYRAMAGADFEVGTFNSPTSGNKDVTTAFDPDFVKIGAVASLNITTGPQTQNLLCLGVSDGTTHYCLHTRDKDNVATSLTETAQISGYLQRWGDGAGAWSTTTPQITACTMGTSKFTLTYGQWGATSNINFYVAIGGVDAKVTTNTQPTTDTTSDSALSFTPETAEFFSNGYATSANVRASSLEATIGFTDGTNHRSICMASVDGAGTSDTERVRSENDAVYFRDDSSNNDGDATAALQTNNIQLSWANTDGTQREIVVVALRDSAAAVGRIMGSLAGLGGLAGQGGLAGRGGGCAG